MLDKHSTMRDDYGDVFPFWASEPSWAPYSQRATTMGYGKDLLRYGRNTRPKFILGSFNFEGQKGGPKLHPGGGFFGLWPFITLKSSHQDLSNEGSNFILSQLEVGHWVARTRPFFDKLTEITDFGLLQQSQLGQDSELIKFWPRALIE